MQSNIKPSHAARFSSPDLATTVGALGTHTICGTNSQNIFCRDSTYFLKMGGEEE